MLFILKNFVTFSFLHSPPPLLKLLSDCDSQLDIHLFYLLIPIFFSFPFTFGEMFSALFFSSAFSLAQMVKNLLARDSGWIPGLGPSLGEGNGYPLQYSYLENSMDRGARWATIQEVTKSQTQLSMHAQ